jgi:hypothetical protein
MKMEYAVVQISARVKGMEKEMGSVSELRLVFSELDELL